MIKKFLKTLATPPPKRTQQTWPSPPEINGFKYKILYQDAPMFIVITDYHMLIVDGNEDKKEYLDLDLLIGGSKSKTLKSVKDNWLVFILEFKEKEVKIEIAADDAKELIERTDRIVSSNEKTRIRDAQKLLEEKEEEEKSKKKEEEYREERAREQEEKMKEHKEFHAKAPACGKCGAEGGISGNVWMCTNNTCRTLICKHCYVKEKCFIPDNLKCDRCSEKRYGGRDLPEWLYQHSFCQGTDCGHK